MKRRKQLMGLAAATVLLGGCFGAGATITLTLQDAGSRAQTGFTSAGGAGATIAGNELIGIYRFVSSDTTMNPFWSTCLSPNGSLDWGTHTYTSYSFDASDPGRNPASWAGGTTYDWGIQNAQYLWRAFSPAIIASGNAAQGAGLALAIYEALYDSTAYGATTGNPFATGATGGGRFYVTQGLSGAVLTAYTSYIGALNTPSSAATVSSWLGNGYILRSTETGAGQDLIWNVTPVPEPATFIAGALLLIPFGASTIRFVRKNRQA